jgi:Xaa-Pro aminopeptidase
MQQVGLVKTADELAIIEEACAIGDSVTQRALEETRAGAARTRSPATRCRRASTWAARWRT